MGPAASAPAGRILALDLGDARVGVALSDALGLTARPYATLPFRGEKALAREVAALVRT
ncbi:MAG: Holliday junction resolvase RuvX, partial [Candidatus Methylomirabilis sp.]|nr:Holliday junction resolvase RuvX [Deltaproteobacteria bacterium]